MRFLEAFNILDNSEPNIGINRLSIGNNRACIVRWDNRYMVKFILDDHAYLDYAFTPQDKNAEDWQIVKIDDFKLIPISDVQYQIMIGK